jgi:hypothetical protein
MIRRILSMECFYPHDSTENPEMVALTMALWYIYDRRDHLMIKILFSSRVTPGN